MLLQQIQAFLAAVAAKNYLTALMLGVSIAQTIIADLMKQGKQPHVVLMATEPPGTLDDCLARLTAETAQAAGIDWTKVLALVQAAVGFLLRIIVGG